MSSEAAGMTCGLPHGGDVLNAAREAGCNPEHLVDFSANINPNGLPANARKALKNASEDTAGLLRYPDWTKHPLRMKLAARLSVPVESIVIGAGASALITDTIRAFAPKRCMAFSPAFSEYKRSAAAVGAAFHEAHLDRVSDFRLDVDAARQSIDQVKPDLIFVNNPHNPSGALTAKTDLSCLVSYANRAACHVLLDEAFIDYTPAEQMTSEAAEHPGMVAIRSLTKFYGCPALRIGYAVADPLSAARIEEQMAAWPVGTLPLSALDAALDDHGFPSRTIEANTRQRDALTAALTSLRIRVFPSAANYLLLELPAQWPDSSEIRSLLLHQHHVLVRDCKSFNLQPHGRFIRVAVLDRERNEQLTAAFSSLRLKLPQ